MIKGHYHFVAAELGTGAVSKDGSEFTIEFETESERLWVTLPSATLERLKALSNELHVLSIDAKNGTASRWHVPQKSLETTGGSSDQNSN